MSVLRLFSFTALTYSMLQDCFFNFPILSMDDSFTQRGCNEALLLHSWYVLPSVESIPND